MKRAVFLDRDGVINEAVIREGKPYPPATLSDVKISENFEYVLQKLKAKGFVIVGITNQPDVARGLQTRAAVEEINQHLLKKLPIETILVCYHDEKDACSCRKPKPGLILDAAAFFDIDLANSYVVGDRWKDIEAGKNAGCKTIFINYAYLEQQPKGYDFSVRKPSEILDIICGPK
jgi:D-glycero-D-manno-heptose 1,7-bisphosphate phosphatase